MPSPDNPLMSSLTNGEKKRKDGGKTIRGYLLLALTCFTSHSLSTQTKLYLCIKNPLSIFFTQNKNTCYSTV